jgi:hypothetical protein
MSADLLANGHRTALVPIEGRSNRALLVTAGTVKEHLTDGPGTRS